MDIFKDVFRTYRGFFFQIFKINFHAKVVTAWKSEGGKAGESFPFVHYPSIFILKLFSKLLSSCSYILKETRTKIGNELFSI